jgi:RNA polymerase sigma-70 factor (ECF subfamily)
MKDQPENIRTDRDLIGVVLEFGDEQAFRELYRRHTPRLLGFVSRLLGGANPEGEDVVQETWARVCEDLGRFQWRSTFSTWLLGIGLHVARDNLRRNKRPRTMTEDPYPDRTCQNKDSESRIDLERAIQMLPDSNRMVLVLHDIEGLTHQEIAEQLEMPEGTTKSQLFRARRMIREWLSGKKEQDNEEP